MPSYQTRPLTEKIPDHLVPYIAKQDPFLYTPMDHAVWRFMLKVASHFFSTHAHPKYLEGLEETGISSERIPLISEMDQKLRRFGWRAVAVNGFIPPAIFMEFQSLGILPIACEMRTIDHLSYTPAPDIFHEAAGHAPIIADPGYAEYLRNYGEVSRKAIYSSQDMDVYEAIRDLSDIKEDPRSTPKQIEEAQKRFEKMSASVTWESEANLLARMFWWTVEYGLIEDPKNGNLKNPKLYGAGLLSSVGESFHCLDDSVKKIPFTLDCVNTSYDITRPQPQLFVTKDFEALIEALEKYSLGMAYRKGGIYGLDLAIKSATVTTVELDTGVQVSGVCQSYQKDQAGHPCFVKFSGPAQISFEGEELPGHSALYHSHGFSSPFGFVKNPSNGITSSADLSREDLSRLGFGEGPHDPKRGKLEFDSGITLEGILVSRVERGKHTVVMTFENCTVRRGKEILFAPSWGMFDMVCGSKVLSVFGGAADRARYLYAVGGIAQKTRIPKTNLTDHNRILNELYAEVRAIRESAPGSGKPPENAALNLGSIYELLCTRFPEDWLLRYELLELDKKWNLNAVWAKRAHADLDKLSTASQDKRELIMRGRAIL